ncbi:hypothetical protein [Roseimicrobium sp. ORNL1]|uniref:hypothetical protein n=1 Tax=Roseimicrobium sp. ORNL1 TaxID=2711231 RepID=UPI001980103E|nr:hypothetical protein [Roseimicrobium sp. ORNL1]
MLLLLIATAWIITGFAAYGCVLLAIFAWLNRRTLDPTRLPQVLQAGWKSGMLSLVCVLTAALILLIINFSQYPLSELSIADVMEWSKNMTRGLTAVAGIAVISILPTGACWFWERSLRGKRAAVRVMKWSEMNWNEMNNTRDG